MAKLAVSRQSGNAVSKPEVQSAIKTAVSDLKDAFETRSSSRGLTNAQTAIANTLQLAIDSGWVKSGTAKDLITTFLTDSKKGSLPETVETLKAEIKGNRGSGGGGGVRYGGRTTTTRYTGRRGRTTTTVTPAPTPAPTRRRGGSGT